MIWLQLKSVDVTLKGNKVLSNINLDFSEGQNINIIGPNGSGKSTFIGLINRTIYPDIKKDSYVKIYGKKNINIWETRSKIGFVCKDIHNRISPNLTCKELLISGISGTIGMPKTFKPTINHKKLLEKILNDLNINSLAMKKYSQLSDGEQRKCIIARALIHNPKVLILDEINHCLDVRSSIEIMKLLENISKKGVTIINFDNVLTSILQSSTRVLFIKNGEIINDGKPEELISSSSISKLFNTSVAVKKINKSWISYPI